MKRAVKYPGAMPSHLSVEGPRYFMRRHHFYMALLVALGVHLVVLAGWDWMAKPDPVKNIKVLSLKLTGGGEIFTEQREVPAERPVMPTPDQVQAVPPESITPVEETVERTRLDPAAKGLPSALPNQIAELPNAAGGEEEMNLWEEPAAPGNPAPNTSNLLFPPEPSEIRQPDTKVKPKVAHLPRPQAASVKGDEEEADVPMVENHGTGTASKPFEGQGQGGLAPWEARRYVRDVPASGSGTATQVRDAQAIAKYEQELSRWILKHKVYPTYARNNNLNGYVVVRIQIDRQGRLLDYWLELKSQHAILDHAARDMIKRAAPLPPIPPDYPAGEKFEFLIPVSFGIPSSTAKS